MSSSDTDREATEFDDWIVAEFAERGAFTVLVVLVEIGERSVTPLASTYLNVIGTEVMWPEIVDLFVGSGVAWDGVSFFPVAALDGLLDNQAARASLRELETRVKSERLALNEGFFFDRQGQRMMVEEVAAQ